MNENDLAGTAVTFRTPWSQRVMSVLFAILAGLVLAFIAGLLIFIKFGRSAPMAWSVTNVLQASAGVAIILTAVGLWLFRAQPSRLRLDEASMRAAGLAYRRSMAYDQVALITVERPENTVGKLCRLVVRNRRGKAVSIWLTQDDAAECHAALRALCPQASAIDLDGDVLAPEDDDHQRQGMLVASREFRRRGRRRLLAAAVLGLLGGMSIVALVGHYQGTSAARNIARRWFSAVAFPVMAVGAGASGMANLRRARELRNGHDEGEPLIEAPGR